jgi:hemerythrin-like domain-containing protein
MCFTRAKRSPVLFPALEDSNEFTLSGNTKRPFAEHKEDRGLIERRQMALITDRPDKFIMNARKLIHLLSEHTEREEQLLFPLAERILTMANEDRIVVKLQEADARFGFRQRELLMGMLQQLQDKYIGKA